MIPFGEYANRFKFAKLERRDGILQITLHTEGKELRWGRVPHAEMVDVFAMVGQDRENRVVILTGTGSEFSGPRPDLQARRTGAGGPQTPSAWDEVYWDGRHLLMNFLNIEVPVIAAVNGPACRHAEMPLLADIVLASEDATFEDAGHFVGGLMPGDGVHVVFPLLLGINRARYFMLTGRAIAAPEAMNLGLVAEVLPRDKLLARAWEHAERLNQQPLLMLRYTRVMFTEMLKRQMQDLLGYGLALEGLVALDRPAAPKPG